jgi:hypothetical protein
LTAALAVTGHEPEAREALRQSLALPSSAQLRTIAAWKAFNARFTNGNSDPRVSESNDQFVEGMRKAGTPEE